MTFRDNIRRKISADLYIDPTGLSFALSRGHWCCYTIKDRVLFIMHDDTHYSVIFYKSYYSLMVFFYFGNTLSTEETFSVTGRISVIDNQDCSKMFIIS